MYIDIKEWRSDNLSSLLVLFYWWTYIIAHLCIIHLMITSSKTTFVVPPLYQFNGQILNKTICCATVLYLFHCMLLFLLNLDTVYKVLNRYCYIAFEPGSNLSPFLKFWHGYLFFSAINYYINISVNL